MQTLFNSLRRIVRLLALTFFITLAGAYMLQDHLLYFPQRASLSEMLEPGLAAWPSGTDFRGLIAEPPSQIKPRGTAIVFHGNAGHAAHRRYYADTLSALGLRVILAEYPGYGPRDGKPGELPLVADAAETIALALKTYGGPVLVIGESLGAGVAAAAVAQVNDNAVSLLLITPWDTLANVAAYHYPWLPVRWLVGESYNSVSNLRDFAQPTMVVVAERDDIVPARFGVALYEGVTAPRKFISISGVGHNDWSDAVDAQWWRSTLEFLLPVKP